MRLRVSVAALWDCRVASRERPASDQVPFDSMGADHPSSGDSSTVPHSADRYVLSSGEHDHDRTPLAGPMMQDMGFSERVDPSLHCAT